MGRVENKVVIVTGAAGGLGESISRRLHAEGAMLVLTDIVKDKLESLVHSLGNNALAVVHDVTDEQSWVDVIKTAIDTYGKLDVLVNNAGIVVVGNVEETSLSDYRRVNSIHAEGTFLGCKYALPAMRSTGDGSGSIINMSSVTAIGGFSYVLAYSAAKGAVRSMTKSIAASTSEKGEPIRCNSIHPGRIDTAMVKECRDDREKNREQEKEDKGNHPGRPDDVAHIVVYLASDESFWMNGSEMVIDNAATITDGRVKLRPR